MNAREFLFQCLQRRVPLPGMTWLRERSHQGWEKGIDDTFFMAFSQAIRYTGKKALEATTDEKAASEAFHPGWDLHDWTQADAARAILLLSLPEGNTTVASLLSLHRSADLGENLSLLRSLFLLKDAKGLLPIAREAVRSNIRDLFAALSQHNPYPAAYLDENAWNQMVVKCFFVDLPLYSILGLEKRNNQPLAKMIVDLWQERHAAHRFLSPEAWRCVGPFADEAILKVLRLLLEGEPAQRNAAALALWAAPQKSGQAILNAKFPEALLALKNQTLTWENFQND